MYRHPFYPPLSTEELQERDALLALCKGTQEAFPRNSISSPSSNGFPSSSGGSRVFWGSIDGGKGKCKIRRSCLGFSADGSKVLAGFHDSVAIAAVGTLSAHLNIGVPGVGLVLPHPVHPELVAVGCQRSVIQLESVTYGCCFGLGGRVLIAAQEDGCCRVLPSAATVDSGAAAAALQVPLLQGPAVVTAASGRDGEVFAVGGGDGSIQILDTASLSPVGSLPRGDVGVQCMALSSDGSLIAWATKRTPPEKEESLMRRLDEGPRPGSPKLCLAAVSPTEVLLQLETSGQASGGPRGKELDRAIGDINLRSLLTCHVFPSRDHLPYCPLALNVHWHGTNGGPSRSRRLIPNADASSENFSSSTGSESCNKSTSCEPTRQTEKSALHHIAVQHACDFSRVHNGSSSRRNTCEPANAVFAVEEVFGPDSSQQHIFESVALPLVQRCCSGREACVVVYGQTSSGKTHTLLGPQQQPHREALQKRAATRGYQEALAVDGEVGLLQRVGAALLRLPQEQQQQQLGSQLRVERVSISFLEIYKEVLTDLLTGEGPLRLRQLQHPHGGVQVIGLSEIQLPDVFTLQREERSGVLRLVDLAGTERSSAAMTQGSLLQEGAAINQSLFCFCQCIDALVSRQRALAGGASSSACCCNTPTGVNFRDSKLTRLLQPALTGEGGAAALLICVSQRQQHARDTFNALSLGCKALQLQPKPHQQQPQKQQQQPQKQQQQQQCSGVCSRQKPQTPLPRRFPLAAEIEAETLRCVRRRQHQQQKQELYRQQHITTLRMQRGAAAARHKRGHYVRIEALAPTTSKC
ncbi:putative kinesin [Cyclospora cayetanensis]|uniref:Kinesin n=1 Tax=Cyclospora cayetanensis TaxID=88456 RepID=A0A1D3CRH8_9EIME|nr:putative kinesin [Cyclospora cayetanensis]